MTRIFRYILILILLFITPLTKDQKVYATDVNINFINYVAKESHKRGLRNLYPVLVKQKRERTNCFSKYFFRRQPRFLFRVLSRGLGFLFLLGKVRTEGVDEKSDSLFMCGSCS